MRQWFCSFEHKKSPACEGRQKKSCYHWSIGELSHEKPISYTVSVLYSYIVLKNNYFMICSITNSAVNATIPVISKAIMKSLLGSGFK